MREVVNLTLGRTQIALRPTFEAYGDIESRVGKPLREIYMAVFSGTAKLNEMAMIVHIGAAQIEGQLVDERTGVSMSPDGIARALYEQGPWDLDAVIQPIADYIASLGWTPEQRKKIEAEADKQG